MGTAPPLSSQDFTLSAGKPNAIGLDLARVSRNGVCVFTVWGEKPFKVEVGPGEQIPEGDSDFYGMVLSTNVKEQTARVRVFDLDHPIPSDALHLRP